MCSSLVLTVKYRWPDTSRTSNWDRRKSSTTRTQYLKMAYSNKCANTITTRHLNWGVSETLHRQELKFNWKKSFWKWKQFLGLLVGIEDSLHLSSVLRKHRKILTGVLDIWVVSYFQMNNMVKATTKNVGSKMYESGGSRVGAGGWHPLFIRHLSFSCVKLTNMATWLVSLLSKVSGSAPGINIYRPGVRWERMSTKAQLRYP